MKTSESITNIITALLKAQKSMGAAKKEATNPYFHSSYADLGSVMEACKSQLNENDIVILQPIMGMMVETVLLHISGEWMSSETPIEQKEEHNPQALGSAITYARRYGLQSMVFIPAEDDDGNTANQHKKSETPTEARIIKGSSMPATSKQIGMIASLLLQKGRTDEELYTKYNVESKKDLTIVQASQIIENLIKLSDVEQVNPDEIPEDLEK